AKRKAFVLSYRARRRHGFLGSAHLARLFVRGPGDGQQRGCPCRPNMSVSRWKPIFEKILRPHLNRSLNAADGLPAKVLADAERRLGLNLPEALRHYYELAGGLEINRSYNRILPPEEFETGDDRLIFMEENQDVVTWGILLSDLRLEDPVVWQREN